LTTNWRERRVPGGSWRGVDRGEVEVGRRDGGERQSTQGLGRPHEDFIVYPVK